MTNKTAGGNFLRNLDRSSQSYKSYVTPDDPKEAVWHLHVQNLVKSECEKLLKDPEASNKNIVDACQLNGIIYDDMVNLGSKLPIDES